MTAKRYIDEAEQPAPVETETEVAVTPEPEVPEVAAVVAEKKERAEEPVIQHAVKPVVETTEITPDVTEADDKPEVTREPKAAAIVQPETMPEKASVVEAQSVPEAAEIPESPDLVEAATTIEAAPEQPVFDENLINTWEQLTEHAAAVGDAAEELNDAVAAGEPLAENETVALQVERAVPPSIEGFENQVAAIQVSAETVPEIDDIVEVASEQSLEETLVQLAVSLSESSADTYKESERLPAVQQALEEVRELLPLNTEITEEMPVAEIAAPKERPEITPELTQKLLNLAQAVGYDNPHEALLQFVDRNGFERLTEAVNYLHLQSGDYDRQDWLHAWLNSAAIKPVAAAPAKLGKAVVSLIAPRAAWQAGV